MYKKERPTLLQLKQELTRQDKQKTTHRSPGTHPINEINLRRRTIFYKQFRLRPKQIPKDITHGMMESYLFSHSSQMPTVLSVMFTLTRIWLMLLNKIASYVTFVAFKMFGTFSWIFCAACTALRIWVFGMHSKRMFCQIPKKG